MSDNIEPKQNNQPPAPTEGGNLGGGGILPTEPLPGGLMDAFVTLPGVEQKDVTLPVDSSPPISLKNEVANTQATVKEVDDSAQRGPVRIGERLGRKYQIERLIGRGGFGTVYLAKDLFADRQVAVKILHPHSQSAQEGLQRFLTEARACAKLEHPNVVRMYDMDFQGATRYLVMEYLTGESLQDRLRNRGRISLMEALPIVTQIGTALDYMARRGIVHRDLKPDNIYLHRQENGEVVKVLDFGIARLSSDQGITGPNAPGTPLYMSPEQFRGKVDSRSDLYSLGIMLFQMLSGKLPFQADEYYQLMLQHIQQPPPDLHYVNPEVPPTVAAIVTRLLSKSPTDRYQTAKDFLADLFQAVGLSRPVIGEASDEMPVIQLDEVLESPRNSKLVIQEELQQSTNLKIIHAVRGKLAFYAVLPVILVFSLLGWFLFVRFHDSQKGPETALKESATVRFAIPKEFIKLAGGEITIGRRQNEIILGDVKNQIDDAEIPAHQVSIKPFYISQYEVTNQEYLEFLNANSTIPAPRNWKEGRRPPIGTERNPVTGVSWKDATAYCEWRAKQNGLDYRLPTEFEWEYAARGNDTRVYPWGDIWNNEQVNANKRDKAAQTALAVDVTPNNTGDVSPFKIFALGGNVSEWTSSKFVPYPESRYKPKNEDLLCYVFRGGSFKSEPNSCRTSYRSWEKPEYKDDYLGFRVVISVPDPSQR